MTADWGELEKKVNQVIRLLDDIIPEKTYLYLPLISAVIFWGLKQRRDWKKQIFSQEVWPAPKMIREKPDDYILEFFRNRPGLKREFKPELERKDRISLREAFEKLYPVVGLEDPFLSALFKDELEENNYRRVVKDFNRRIESAQRDIHALKGNLGLIETLDGLYRCALSLGSDVLTQRDVQKSLVRIIEKQVHKNES